MENYVPMKVPKVVVVREPGTQFMSLLLKAYDPSWGSEGALADETKSYFASHPGDASVAAALGRMNALKEGGPSEWMLYYAACAYGRPDRTALAADLLARFGGIPDAAKLVASVHSLIGTLEASPSLGLLVEKFDVAAEEDMRTRMNRLGEMEGLASDLVRFFKPNAGTVGIETFEVLPTEPLRPKAGSMTFRFGGEFVVMHHIDRKEDLEIGFLRSMTDLFAERLAGSLSDADKAKAVSLSSGKSRETQKDFIGIFAEELASTYSEVFKGGSRPEEFQDFRVRVLQWEPGEFQKMLDGSPVFAARCASVGIADLVGMQAKTEEYYDAFEKNELRGVIFGLYKDYARAAETGAVDFESFLLREFPSRLYGSPPAEAGEEPVEEPVL